LHQTAPAICERRSSLVSLLSFHRLLYLCGREVSRVRMRVVIAVEVEWASEIQKGKRTKTRVLNEHIS
jgi:hypothetical protein